MQAKLENPNRSHWISTEYGSGGPLSKEELYPIATVEGVPRAGTVSVELSADRYVAQSYDEATNTSSPVWTDWRIYVKRVEPAQGVGPKTIAAISDAVVPVVRAWIASEGYKASRAVAIAYTVRRIITEATLNEYGLKNARTELERNRAELTPYDADRFGYAIDALETAASLLAT